MTNAHVICPRCHNRIKLTKTLVKPWIASVRKQFEQQRKKSESDLSKREAALRNSQRALTKAHTAIDAEVSARLHAERATIADVEAKKARLALAADLKRRDQQMVELQNDLRARNDKLAQAQKAHAEVIRKSRALDDAKRELDLSIQLKVQESLEVVRQQAKSEIEDRFKSALTEREAQIIGMRHQIEDLRRRAEQGSQQLQGEALELELESSLRRRFPTDLFEPVAKGVFGGDLIHRVMNQSRQLTGTILWECKRTKAWSDRWLTKARADKRAAKAELVLIVSDRVPDHVQNFDLVDDVWITQVRFSLPLATALRQSLIDRAESRKLNEGHLSRSELVYKYFTGVQFKQRIEGIVEQFSDMRRDLDRERAAMMRIWAKREAQLQAVLDGSAALYGDIQGIAGRAVPGIKQLDLQLIENAKSAAK